MTAQAISPPGHAELEAARLLLARMGISPSDLLNTAPARPPAPTFAAYIPIVSAAAGADNPARKVAKPRRLPSTRRAVADVRLAEINQVAATTGNDPALDSLLLRLHTETACRRGGALALRPADLDPDQCLILLR